MTAETLKLRSSVKSSLKKFVLIRGTVLAVLGVCILLYGALFLAVETLAVWGFPMLFVAIALIAIGLMPYRRLCRREKRPDEIVENGNLALHYNMEGRPTFTIPLVSIDRKAYVEKGRDYGIAIWLKQPLPQKLIVFNPNVDMEKYQQESLKRHGSDLFFPYFTERSYKALTAFEEVEED